MATNRKRYTTSESRGQHFWTNIVGYVFVAQVIYYVEILLPNKSWAMKIFSKKFQVCNNLFELIHPIRIFPEYFNFIHNEQSILCVCLQRDQLFFKFLWSRTWVAHCLGLVFIALWLKSACLDATTVLLCFVEHVLDDINVIQTNANEIKHNNRNILLRKLMCNWLTDVYKV